MGPVHVSAATQPTLQVLPLQVIRFVHEPAPTQLMAQELAAVQSMVDAHEPAPTQVIAHGTPGGQTIGPGHVPAAVHVTVQVPAWSHVPTPASAHTEGHTSAASRVFASPVPASDFVASDVAVSSPSPSLASRRSVASESSALASSEPNVTSGKEHATPVEMPALPKATTT
jgi:hypothetical protein